MKCSVLSIILFLTLLLICLTTGCSTQWHLQRAIKKDPTILVQDTVVVMDTVVTNPTAVLDTVTISKVDTIEIVKNNFRVKIMRSYDTLIIDGGCESDTIVRTVEVPIEKIVYHEREKWYHKLYKWSFFLLLFGLGAEGLRRIFRFS
tara:strand:+ start:64 stop:504 length:441 start_codon:yes stop_codon:yes gene_type:complete